MPRRLPALLAASAIGLAACTLYGASFDYPDDPPVPPGTTVVASAEGQDDDDPMRGREVVVEVDAGQPDEVVAFYRDRFSTQDGWVDGEAGPDTAGGHLLCRVSHDDGDYDEYVEVYPYDTGHASAAPGRYLVSISRLDRPHGSERSAQQCGLAGIWFPSDL